MRDLNTMHYLAGLAIGVSLGFTPGLGVAEWERRPAPAPVASWIGADPKPVEKTADPGVATRAWDDVYIDDLYLQQTPATEAHISFAEVPDNAIVYRVGNEMSWGITCGVHHSDGVCPGYPRAKMLTP